MPGTCPLIYRYDEKVAVTARNTALRHVKQDIIAYIRGSHTCLHKLVFIVGKLWWVTE